MCSTNDFIYMEFLKSRLQQYNIMLCQNIISLNAENRRSEKTLVQLQLILKKIDFSTYQSLIEWGFEISAQLQLLPSTKFLTRAYFDKTIASYQDIQVSQYLTYFVTSLSLAIKFNQLREVSEQLTPQKLFRAMGANFSREYYLSLEWKILCALKLKFQFTTPYDYIDIFIARFPFLPKIRSVLPFFIEFALIQPRACQFKAEQIFFGALLCLFESRSSPLTQFQKNILETLTDCWRRARVIADLIAIEVRKYSNSEQNY